MERALCNVQEAKPGGYLLCWHSIHNHKSSIINLSELLRLQWMGMAAKIQQRNEVVNRQCVELQTRLASDGFASCVLKGQGLAALYTSRSTNSGQAVSSAQVVELRGLRQSGDIDIWMDGTWEQVMDYVNARTPNREFDMKHTYFEAFDDTVVETHWRPTVTTNPIENKRLTRYFDDERERQLANEMVLPNGEKICAPTADFQLVHAMLHVFGHFLYEGVA